MQTRERCTMHSSTKLVPALRKEVYKEWRTGKYSLRELAASYHVDKRVISRVIERGKKGDFSVHDTVNHRYKKGARKAKKK